MSSQTDRRRRRRRRQTGNETTMESLIPSDLSSHKRFIEANFCKRVREREREIMYRHMLVNESLLFVKGVFVCDRERERRRYFMKLLCKEQKCRYVNVSLQKNLTEIIFRSQPPNASILISTLSTRAIL